MNKSTKVALINFQASSFQLKASLFHSTPILERKRRTDWNGFSRRGRKLNAKQDLLRNVSAFTEHLFQSWQHDHDAYDSSESYRRSWFNPDSRAYGSRWSKSKNSGPRVYYRRGFQFFEDDDDIEVENFFDSAFGGSRNFYYSFIDDEPRWWSSGGYSKNRRFYSNPRFSYQEEYDTSNDSDSSELDLRSDRLALGLNASGPLSLEDVKNAYRGCALKWHPDRHQGSSKAMAEEKFKTCSAAYQSICNRLALN